jgi:hypothetical protein
MATTYSLLQTTAALTLQSGVRQDTGEHNTCQDAFSLGLTDLPAISLSLAEGTGAGKAAAGAVLHRKVTFAVGNTDFDLQGITDPRFTSKTIAFTLVKWFLLRIRTPTTGVYLLVGNYGANGFVGWQPNNTTAEKVHSVLFRDNPIDGWAVDGTHRYLRINNPGAATVLADLIMIGE